MLLSASFNPKFNPLQTAIPSFAYLTSNMIASQSTSKYVLDSKDLVDINKVREIFTDVQLQEWVKQIDFIFNEHSGYLFKMRAQLVDLFKMKRSSLKTNKQPGQHRIHKQLREFFNSQTNELVAAIRDDKLSGRFVWNENHKTDFNCPWNRTKLFETESGSSVITIHPCNELERYMSICAPMRESANRGVLHIYFGNAMLSQPVGMDAVKASEIIMDEASVNKFIEMNGNKFF